MKSYLFHALNLQPNLHGWAKLSAIIAIFVLLPLGQLGRLYLDVGGAVYLHELAMLVTLALFAPQLWANLRTIKIKKVPSKVKVALILLLWVLIGTTVTSWRLADITPLLYLLRLFFYGLFLGSAGSIFNSNQKLLQVLVILAGSWYWWLAVLQFLLMPDTRFLWLYGWDDHYHRVIGTLFDPGLTGIIFILTLLLTVQLKDILGKRLSLIAVLGLAFGIVFTYSRASYLSLTIALAVLSYMILNKGHWKKNLRQYLYLTLVGVVTLVLLLTLHRAEGEGVRLLRTSTITARIENSTQALYQLQPLEYITGTGLFSSTAHHESKATVPDNIFVTLLSQTGLIGVVLVSWLGYHVAKATLQAGAIYFTALVAIIIQSQFNNTLLHPVVIIFGGLFIVSAYFRFTVRSSST